ncbi:SAM-dependent methyltransferase [Natronogracilivirga saccharolytica]|uniref:Methyltransferase domain-containing protein n=1 Tax=Natronogracilivirga saccharolytica TaxID=2812953 RepID=A0A8J7S959_9BACT|nr:methyltransferase domain-containing protein [Natronogracilivirga saccharolytica]MBP3192623.1 methyltransferase domain-containing protein [Natronogracilivirga saccharolytica]
MSNETLNPVDIARDYYNSSDADTFYATIWGGEDIHVGLYESESDSIPDASRRTQKRMTEQLLNRPDASSRIIDLGSGYGGTARFLAGQYGCRVAALNLSEVENNRARKLNREQNLDNLVDVIDGDYAEVPFDDESFDLVWSQDALLHSPARKKVIEEVSRILKPGGEFVFTDPMQADNCPEGVLQPIFDRIHLESMGSPGFYRETAAEFGLKEIDYLEMTDQLQRHYSAVLKNTEMQEDKLREHVSQQYLQNMKKGLQHWIDGASNGYLSWGIMHFQKQ